MQGFGKWLFERRKGAGLTQGQLARKAGISTSYVSTLEREEPHRITNAPPQPATDVVEALAKALGVSLDEARLAAGYAPLNGTQSFTIGPKARIALLDQSLTPEEQNEIAEEMALAYEVVMERRRRRLAQNE